jgi:hypothetical protein
MKLAASLAFVVAVYAPEFPAAIRIMAGAPPRIELTNTGTQPITAWSFTVSTPKANGAHHETHTADVYLSEVTGKLPGAEPHLDRIMPGQSRALPIDAASPGATVEIAALVLQDGTALGDATVIKTFFEHRGLERDQLRAVAETFRTVLAAKRGTAALADLKQQLQSSAGGESVPQRTARDAVDALLRKAQGGNEDEADRSARAYGEFVTRQYDAAVAHSRRKPEGASSQSAVPNLCLLWRCDLVQLRQQRREPALLRIEESPLVNRRLFRLQPWFLLQRRWPLLAAAAIHVLAERGHQRAPVGHVRLRGGNA